MNTALRILPVLVLLGILVSGGAARADHDGGGPAFTDRSLAGSWGFSASGVIVPPALPEHTHAAAVGIMEFDGSGGCIIRDTINIGGFSASNRLSESCFYQVNPDGTGTIEAQFAGEPGPVPLSFVIIGRAWGLRFIRTDLGVASGEAYRQRGRHHH